MEELILSFAPRNQFLSFVPSKTTTFFFFLMKLYVLLQNVQFDMLYGIFQMINSFLLLPVIFFYHLLFNMPCFPEV